MKKVLLSKIMPIFLMIAMLIGCNEQQATKQSDESANKLAIITSYEQINLHISKPDSQGYSIYKKISEPETIETILDMLSTIDWEDAKVDMSREADYKIRTLAVDPSISYVATTYAFWLTPNKDVFEVIIEGQAKYGKLSTDYTESLLTIFE